jgi:hypothetical protein
MMMWRRVAGLLVGAAASLVSATAFAGPVEQLDAVSIDPADPSHIIVSYRYGGGGMFVSHDGGKKFGWLCSAGVATSAVNRNGRAIIGTDGAIFLGQFDGLLKGQPDGCGFAPVAEMDKKYIADLATDPIDPKRTYVVTTNPMVDNFIYMSEGGGPFMPFGAPVQHFIDSLDVVKVGEGRRFYETGVVTNVMTNEVKYSVRVSDDNAETWTDEAYDLAQFGPMDMYAEFSIVAINPTNPDEIIGRVWRKQAVDTLVVSKEKGKAGSWQMLAEPTEAEGIVYTPEGVLYFGDSDQKTPGLYVVEKSGDAPKMLSNTWKVMCLGYDSANKRLLGCSNFYLFGEVDTEAGTLEPLLDLRCTENFVECAGQEEMAMVCEPQAKADFCHVTHWVIAPLCDAYDRGADLITYQQAQTIMCVDGFGVPKVEGSTPGGGAAGGGAAGAPATGVGGTTGSMNPASTAAGASAPASAGSGGTAAGGSKKSSGGCSVTEAAPSAGLVSWLVSFGTLALVMRSRRRK